MDTRRSAGVGEGPVPPLELTLFDSEQIVMSRRLNNGLN